MKNNKIIIVFIVICVIFFTFENVYAYIDDAGYFYHDEIKQKFKTEDDAKKYARKNNIKLDGNTKDATVDGEEQVKRVGCYRTVSYTSPKGESYYKIECIGHKIGAENKYYHESTETVYGKDNAINIMQERCNNYEIIDDPEKGHRGYCYAECKGHPISLSEGFNQNYLPTSNNKVNKNLKKSVDKIAGSIILILQVVTVSTIIFTGVRYMFAGADSKNEIKKTLPFLITGIVIVFAGPIVIKFIIDIFTDITE